MGIKKINLKQGYVPAALWKRAIAYIIDSFIVTFVVAFPLNSVIKFEKRGVEATYQFFATNPGMAYKFVLVSLLSAFIAILYWAILEYKYKQSLGKYLMKIDVRSTLKEFTFSQCFMRNLSKINTLFLAIDSLNIFLGKTHQRYLEKMSKTEVVEMGWNF
jgi:uncharacterized RDD family membrane protein YckC